MTTYRRFENDDAFENGILKDGARVRVPLQMRDSARPTERPLTPTEMHDAMEHHRRNALVTDGTGNPWGLSRPGWRIPVDRSVRDHQRQVLQDAYEEYERNLREAYKTPGTSPASNTGSLKFSAKPQASQACAINGRPGHLVEGEDGELFCQPNDELDRNRLDGMSLAELQQHRRQVTDAAYQEYSNWLSNQWRTK